MATAQNTTSCGETTIVLDVLQEVAEKIVSMQDNVSEFEELMSNSALPQENLQKVNDYNKSCTVNEEIVKKKNSHIPAALLQRYASALISIVTSDQNKPQKVVEKNAFHVVLIQVLEDCQLAKLECCAMEKVSKFLCNFINLTF